MLNKPYDEELLETEPILRDGVGQIARTFTRLEFLGIPQLTFDTDPTTAVAVGPAIKVWSPYICSSACDMANNSLSSLECIEFPAAQQGTPNISITFIVKLASLQHLLRCVVLARSHLEDELLLACLLHSCPTFEEIDISGCKPVTDATLAILGNRPPLRSLISSALPEITVHEIVTFLRKQKLAMFAAIASNAPNMKQLAIRYASPDGRLGILRWGGLEYRLGRIDPFCDS
ncbi:hypothetical protein BDK51DRAFT_28393 [Blyttiomyces helicus]|uniref:F-box domain-containing protein n=1 Tax=Blyttiomyces helicus TaxID=388810 RepID=A0A4P9WUK7_9FUNG|nr:hypothetical protein BDK51DRAFT_28393 [Blyttiomyces helicus]|eukprot:RKO94796.1 hypothetical protein BDK51DRAFT_28393 [Blyttiomyces helicus]